MPVPRRQTIARQWLIIAKSPDRTPISRAERLPRGSGVLLLEQLERGDMLRLRLAAHRRNLVIVQEGRGAAARVHGLSELRDAMIRRTPLLFLSPLHPTRSHPGWRPIGRMRAAALARIAGRRLIALGGMDASRFVAVARLGFVGWAGISAWQGRSRQGKRRQEAAGNVR
jgi:thiamine-phosphate pyrophosphorylase